MPRLYAVRERLGQIITCPVGQNLFDQPGWCREAPANVIVSMTLLPGPSWRPPGHPERSATIMDMTPVWLELNDKRHMEAPAILLEDHYVRRHGDSTATIEALDHVAGILEKALVGRDWGRADPKIIAGVIADFYQRARATVIESIPVLAREKQILGVRSTRPLDALAVIEVMSVRDLP